VLGFKRAETLEKRSILATEIVKGRDAALPVILPDGGAAGLALVQAIAGLNQREERIRAQARMT
jgi:hypothetical protein